MVMKLIKIFTFLTLVSFTLSACSDTKLVTPETEGEKLQILYSNAMELVKKRDFVDAAIPVSYTHLTLPTSVTV